MEKSKVNDTAYTTTSLEVNNASGDAEARFLSLAMVEVLYTRYLALF